MLTTQIAQDSFCAFSLVAHSFLLHKFGTGCYHTNMINPLVGIHAGAGEIGFFLFLWAFVELLNPTGQRVKRARVVILLGTIMFFVAWFAGGYYYVNVYGLGVKPLIKSGPVPWAHDVLMEVKEHVFLFLPFLSLLALGVVHKFRNTLSHDRSEAVALLALCGLIILMGFAMAGMGYMVSSGARSALEAGVSL